MKKKELLKKIEDQERAIDILLKRIDVLEKHIEKVDVFTTVRPYRAPIIGPYNPYTTNPYPSDPFNPPYKITC